MSFFDFLFGRRKKDLGTSGRNVPHSNMTSNILPRAIFEIYTDVVKSPRQQMTADNKYLPKN